MDPDDLKFTVPYVFDACRRMCEASERETVAFMRKRVATERSTMAIAVPVVAVAAVAAFLDDYGRVFTMVDDDARHALRQAQRPGGPSLPRLYARFHDEWFGSPADTAVLDNLLLLYDVRTVLTHPHRRLNATAMASLRDRALLLGTANWPRNSERQAFPHDLMWDEFAVWCFDAAADAARDMIRRWDDTDTGRWLARPFRPYRGTYVPGNPIHGPVARTGS
jgi:hypothetical protein